MIPIPMDRHTLDSRTNVREETTTTIIPGQTTKEDVFLALGEPDEVSPDGSRLVYRWTKVKLVLIIVGPGGGASIPITKGYKLIITLDERGVVLHREFHGELEDNDDRPRSQEPDGLRTRCTTGGFC